MSEANASKMKITMILFVAILFCAFAGESGADAFFVRSIQIFQFAVPIFWWNIVFGSFRVYEILKFAHNLIVFMICADAFPAATNDGLSGSDVLSGQTKDLLSDEEALSAPECPPTRRPSDDSQKKRV